MKKKELYAYLHDDTCKPVKELTSLDDVKQEFNAVIGSNDRIKLRTFHREASAYKRTLIEQTERYMRTGNYPRWERHAGQWYNRLTEELRAIRAIFRDVNRAENEINRKIWESRHG